MTDTSRIPPIEHALRVFGSKSAIAKVLGIRQPSVAGWKDNIPAKRIPKLIAEAEKRGKRLRAADLLPSEAA